MMNQHLILLIFIAISLIIIGLLSKQKDNIENDIIYLENLNFKCPEIIKFYNDHNKNIISTIKYILGFSSHLSKTHEQFTKCKKNLKNFRFIVFIVYYSLIFLFILIIIKYKTNLFAGLIINLIYTYVTIALLFKYKKLIDRFFECSHKCARQTIEFMEYLDKLERINNLDTNMSEEKMINQISDIAEEIRKNIAIQ